MDLESPKTRVLHGLDSQHRQEAEEGLDPFLRRAFGIIQEVTTELMGDGLRVALDSDFERQLGFGSLELVELFTRLEGELGIAVPDSALVEARTPRKLLDALVQSRGDGAPAWADSLEREIASGGNVASVPGEGEIETVVDLLRYRALEEGENTHLRILDESLGAPPVSYTALWGWSAKMAYELAGLGLDRGTRVALLLPSGAEFFAAFVGILRTGCVPVPIYPPVRLDQLAPYLKRHARILADAGVRAIVTDRKIRPAAKLLSERVSTSQKVVLVSGLSPISEGFQDVEIGPDDLGLIQYTSGSTGDPKGVALRHRNLVANMRANGKGLALGPGDVCVSWLPLYHDMGLIGSWMTALLHGVPIILLSPLQFLSRPERWLWAIHRFRGTVSPAPNFGYELCCRKVQPHAIEGLDLSSWRVAMNGSEPVLKETIDRFCERFGPYGFRRSSMMPVYGMAENCVGLAFPPPGREPRIDSIDREVFAATGTAEPAKAKAKTLHIPSVGQALDRHEICVVAPEQSDQETKSGEAKSSVSPRAGTDPIPLPERIQGRILFRGPSMMDGYFQRPDATEAIRVGKWLDSGDLGYIADGELFITGRIKDLIIKGGRNYHPQDIEQAAWAADGVRKGCVAAFAVPDSNRGEAIVVVAETRRPAGELDALSRGLSQAVFEAIGTPPDRAIFVAPGTIPKTSSGKLRRRETRRMFLEGHLQKRRRPWMGLAVVAITSATAKIGNGARAGGRLAYGVAATGLGRLILAAGTIWVSLCRSRESAWKSAVWWIRFLFAAIGIPVRRKGVPLVEGPAVLVVNHGSYLDPLFLMACLERPVTILAIQEAFDWPLFGPCMKRLEVVPVIRSAGKVSLGAYEKAREALRADRPVLIFPEGTFSKANGVRPFRLGAFQLAAEEGVPVQPIGLRGARHVYRDEQLLMRWGPVTVEVLPPIKPASKENFRDVAAQREIVRKQISSACGEALLQITSTAPVVSPEDILPG